MNHVMGASFQDGFIGGVAGALASYLPGSIGEFLNPESNMWGSNVITRTALAGAIGGAVAWASGGSFADGAYTAAFQHLFNKEVKNLEEKIRVKIESRRYRMLGGKGNIALGTNYSSREVKPGEAINNSDEMRAILVVSSDNEEVLAAIADGSRVTTVIEYQKNKKWVVAKYWGGEGNSAIMGRLGYTRIYSSGGAVGTKYINKGTGKRTINLRSSSAVRISVYFDKQQFYQSTHTLNSSASMPSRPSINWAGKKDLDVVKSWF